MCDFDDRERAMVVLARHDDGRARVWCDPCIAPLVEALNNGGILTVASCCGHGKVPGNIALRDGRELVIVKDRQQGRQIEAGFAHGQR